MKPTTALAPHLAIPEPPRASNIHKIFRSSTAYSEIMSITCRAQWVKDEEMTETLHIGAANYTPISARQTCPGRSEHSQAAASVPALTSYLLQNYSGFEDRTDSRNLLQQITAMLCNAEHGLPRKSDIEHDASIICLHTSNLASFVFSVRASSSISAVSKTCIVSITPSAAFSQGPWILVDPESDPLSRTGSGIPLLLKVSRKLVVLLVPVCPEVTWCPLTL